MRGARIKGGICGWGATGGDYWVDDAGGLDLSAWHGSFGFRIDISVII
jgi:hypothetical protein